MKIRYVTVIATVLTHWIQWPLPAAAQTAESAPVALEGIAHVAFRVADVAATRAFYAKLGYEQAFELGSGTSLVSYVKVNDRQFIELYARTSAEQPVGLMHLCFEARDIEGLFDAYVKRGLAPIDKRKARAGNLLFNLRDPDGQVVEYTQYLPGSLHWNERGKHLGGERISDRLVGASIGAKGVGAEREFFARLGFTGGSGTLRLPGGSGEEIVVEAAGEGFAPRITMSVKDTRRAAEELRRRGLTVRMSPDGTSVTDPDGVVITFR